MREDGLKARPRNRFKSTTMNDHGQPVAANLLNRDSTVAAPNRRWVGDTSEFAVGERGELPLAAILDLFSRSVVDWAVSTVNDRHLTVKAPGMAIKRRGPGTGLLHHSDQGSTDASNDYQTIFERCGLTCSMSRRGDCSDDAVMVSVFSTVKAESGEHLESDGASKVALFDDIEVFDNQQRRHSTLGSISPAAFERRAIAPS
jgi:putative transposase